LKVNLKVHKQRQSTACSHRGCRTNSATRSSSKALFLPGLGYLNVEL